ncbi:hypothetical protein VP01_889g11 [Puccinia sorghi]|uniref:Uncharacterized protein n=1 Tax=Puccinia sorghi TaxID=27349 RepID=A0A0L6U886_9BASI|nr:hypothetical protein VP01_889g11 [Puccinia sorghi]
MPQGCVFVVLAKKDVALLGITSWPSSIFLLMKKKIEIVMVKDIQTILKHLNMNPDFTPYICCPKCYTLYPIETCQTQSSCTVQRGVEEWISWFLLLPHVEQSIKDWTKRVQNAPLEPVFNYQQSNGWNKTNPDKVKPNTQGSFLKLMFSLYTSLLWFTRSHMP